MYSRTSEIFSTQHILVKAKNVPRRKTRIKMMSSSPTGLTRILIYSLHRLREHNNVRNDRLPSSRILQLLHFQLSTVNKAFDRLWRLFGLQVVHLLRLGLYRLYPNLHNHALCLECLQVDWSSIDRNNLHHSKDHLSNFIDLLRACQLLPHRK